MQVLENKSKGNQSNNWIIWSIALFFIISSIIYIKVFYLGFYKINSTSMCPTLQVGDMVIVDKHFFKKSTLYKNEIVYFHQNNLSKDFVKRIVALEGDTVLFLNDNVFINNIEFRKDNEFDRSWIHNYKKVVVGKDEVFLLGDNLNISSDSREWGPINKDRILGEICYIYFSKDDYGFHFDRIGSSLK